MRIRLHNQIIITTLTRYAGVIHESICTIVWHPYLIEIKYVADPFSINEIGNIISTTVVQNLEIVLGTPKPIKLMI
jgi:hypothetical protein